MDNYSPYQQKIIKRYYNQQDNIACAKLAEIVSEMYLASDQPKVMARLWKRAEKALVKVSIPESRRNMILEKKELQSLADLLNEIF